VPVDPRILEDKNNLDKIKELIAFLKRVENDDIEERFTNECIGEIECILLSAENFCENAFKKSDGIDVAEINAAYERIRNFVTEELNSVRNAISNKEDSFEYYSIKDEIKEKVINDIKNKKLKNKRRTYSIWQ
jgi:hypothetical protein